MDRLATARFAGLLFGAGSMAFGLVASSAPPPAAPKPVVFATAVAPVLKQFCAPCHSGVEPAAGLDLSRFKTEADVQKATDVWAKVVNRVTAGQMPPKGASQPTALQRRALSDWTLQVLGADCLKQDPGRVTLRRLNRFEYDNTVRDLVGVDFHASDDFPTDDVGYGFDNVGDVLSISPLLMEKYLRAAQTIASKAIVAPEDRIVKYEGANLHAPTAVGGSYEGGIELFTNGAVTANHKFTQAGRYIVRITAYGVQAGPEPVKMAVTVKGQIVARVDLTATVATTFEYPVQVDEGPGRIEASFLNDYYNAAAPNPKDRDRNMVVMAIEVKGPLDGAAVPVSQRHLIPAGSTLENLRQILKGIASRAYRRPIRTDELNRLFALSHRAIENGDSFERAVQLGLTGVLVSPNFLFRVENDPANAKTPIRTLNGYELASRLSYFLWSTMPDDELTQLAENGQLLKPTVMQTQVKRMLQDPRASALADGFASQWLELRKLQTVTLDPKTYPAFTETLRADMTNETKAFFAGVVREDRSVLDFLDAKYAYVNQRLAELYGLPAVAGDELRKVTLPDERRGGLLTQASILTVTSNPNRTSPVKRGKWVLENILGTPPPPPPPGVGDLGDAKQVLDVKTLRARLEAHRANPACAVCHEKMDPIGFSLENFDGMGRWRADDAGAAIDTLGVLPDGTKFSGPKELRAVLMTKKDQFIRCLTEKLLIYALGRGLGPADDCALTDAITAAKKDGYKFSAIVSAIVHSTPFTQRRINSK